MDAVGGMNRDLKGSTDALVGRKISPGTLNKAICTGRMYVRAGVVTTVLRAVLGCSLHCRAQREQRSQLSNRLPGLALPQRRCCSVLDWVDL